MYICRVSTYSIVEKKKKKNFFVEEKEEKRGGNEFKSKERNTIHMYLVTIVDNVRIYTSDTQFE